MKLEDFRKARGITYEGLAKLIRPRGVTVTAKMAERYCKGTLPRDDKIMHRIVKVTGGKVTPNDWYGVEGPGGDHGAESTERPAAA